MAAQNVFYDYQQNAYFKIDKGTGETIKSHRNGADVIRFKPQYSGSDYKTRLEVQPSLSPPSITRPPFQVKLDHKHTKNSPFKSHTRSHATLVPLNKKPDGLSVETRHGQSRLEFFGQFPSKLQKYSSIKQKLKDENHSPREGLEGSIVNEQSRTGTIHYGDQSVGATFEAKKIPRNAKSTATLSVSELPESLVMKNQVKRERQIFLKYNSEFRLKKNPRQEEQLKDRKLNLKMLEKLQLEKTNRITSQVYG